MNIKAKNSAFNKSKIADELKKVKIKNKTECTGFSAKKTNKPVVQTIIPSKKWISSIIF